MAHFPSDLKALRDRLIAAEQRAQRAEEEKQRAEEEKQRAEEGKQRAEEEKQKAEEEKQKAEDRALRAEEERDQMQTTFQEYLDLCHIYFSNSLSIQLDKSRSTQGTLTSPKRKCYPKRLLPWEGFLEGQQRRFDEVYEFFHPVSGPPKFFPPVVRSRIWQLSVESPIRKIIAVLGEIEGACEHFQLGQGITFENHPNTLDEEAEEVQERLLAQDLSKTDASAPKQVKADRICVYKDLEDRHTLSYLIEYKPPHKLQVRDLEKGLRPMNLHREVVQEYRIPTDGDERRRYDADRKVGMAITQTFNYMVESGLEYSYLSTGKAFVFLWIEKDDPTTVFYHLFTPGKDLHAPDDQRASAFNTALGQVLAFSLLAFTSERRSPDWREEWRQKLPRWPVDEGMAPRTPDNVKKLKTPPTSEFKGKASSVSRSYTLRTRPTGRNVCREDDLVRYSSSDGDSSSEPEVENMGTPVRATRTAPARATVVSSPVSSRTRERNRTRDYCTQKCLLGLAGRGWLDENCPNVSAHRSSKDRGRHGIDVKSLANLVRKQLGRTLDRDFEPLSNQGARGNLFKVTLASHGYTFVGKGTIAVFVPDLRHEGCVYRKLKRLQGQVVPVYLGNIGLIKSYVDLGVEIVHMLLMAWAGGEARSADVLDLDGEISRSVDELRCEGVEHNDVREPNILWNTEQRRVMLIDLERSRLMRPAFPRPGYALPLQELSPNRKRKQLPGRSAKGHVQRRRFRLPGLEDVMNH